MNKLIATVTIVVLVAVGTFTLVHKPANSTTSPAVSTVSRTSSPVVNNSVLITKSNGTIGSYLADPAGKTLYVYNADTPGVSNCVASCLANWPAYQATGSTSKLPTGISAIKRPDNASNQYTYMGRPLYYFVNDSQSQVTGNGIGNFTVAKPSSTAQSPAVPSTTPVTGLKSPY